MKKICLEQKGQPPTRATLDEPNLNYKKLARLEGSPTLSSHPFVMVGSASQPGQLFSINTLRAFHSTKILFEISENPRAQWNVTFRLHRPNQSHREFGYRLVIVVVSRIQHRSCLLTNKLHQVQLVTVPIYKHDMSELFFFDRDRRLLEVYRHLFLNK